MSVAVYEMVPPQAGRIRLDVAFLLLVHSTSIERPYQTVNCHAQYGVSCKMPCTQRFPSYSWSWVDCPLTAVEIDEPGSEFSAQALRQVRLPYVIHSTSRLTLDLEPGLIKLTNNLLLTDC